MTAGQTLVELPSCLSASKFDELVVICIAWLELTMLLIGRVCGVASTYNSEPWISLAHMCVIYIHMEEVEL